MAKNQFSKRAALKLAAGSAAYIALPTLSFELTASAASRRSSEILREIKRYKLAYIKRWNREKAAYQFHVSFDNAKDALPIVSD